MYKITLKKFATVALLLTLNAGFLNISITNAFYNDTESSTGNDFAAGALDFVLTDSGFDPVAAALNFESGTTTQKTVGMALEPESNPIKYKASTKNASGDVSFCQGIHLNASLNSENQFTGKLTDFVSTATTTIGDWQYDFSMPADSHFYNSVCSFDFEYEGRQTLPHNEYPDGGYYDIETASSTIYSWGFRINKVYYDVETSERGIEYDNEWVEIYNQTDQSLDITNWQICDNGSSCDTLASTSPIMIPAKGFAVITAASSTWNYWELADNVVPIVLEERIGNGLSNDGDRLILKRPDGAIMDEMNWGTDIEVWNPAATDVPEGHTLARKPNGYDTNQASDFVDLAPPIVNLTSPDQSGSLTWYWTYNYNITWTATNQNGGPDSDLKIDLSYIIDRDASSTVTPQDESVVIAKGLPNTGIYNWTVPSGFIGYIWLKIAAFGPENPMLNSQMTSGKIWDPYPLEMILTDPLTVLEGLLDSMNATSTAEIVPETESATTTTELISAGQVIEIAPIIETATTTEEIMPIVEIATTTEEIIPTATTTEEIIPEIIPEIIVEPVVLPEPEIIPEVSEAPSPSQGEGVGDEVVSEPVIMPPEPAIIEETIPTE